MSDPDDKRRDDELDDDVYGEDGLPDDENVGQEDERLPYLPDAGPSDGPAPAP